MKTYNQYCGVALALDLVGDRWTLLIVRDLMPGPRRYNQLMDALPGITTNLLAGRLKGLVEKGLLSKMADGYHLTDQGQGLAPVVLALAEFGRDLLCGPPQDGMALSPRWLALNLKWRYLGLWSGQLALQFPKVTLYVADLGDGLKVSDTALPGDMVTVTSAQGGLMHWILGGTPAQTLLEEGKLTVESDPSVLLTFDAQLKPLEPFADPLNG